MTISTTPCSVPRGDTATLSAGSLPAPQAPSSADTPGSLDAPLPARADSSGATPADPDNSSTTPTGAGNNSTTPADPDKSSTTPAGAGNNSTTPADPDNSSTTPVGIPSSAGAGGFLDASPDDPFTAADTATRPDPAGMDTAIPTGSAGDSAAEAVLEALGSAGGLGALIAQQLAALHDGLDGLVQVADRWELLALRPSEVLDVARQFEVFRNRLATFDHAIVEALETSRAWEPELAGSTTQLLAAACRINHGQAANRVKAAAVLRPREGCSTGPLPPQLPIVAAAQRLGHITGEQTRIIARCISDLQTAGTTQEVLTDAETALTDFAGVFGPKDLARTAAHLLDVHCPDGQLEREHLAHARRELTLGPAHPDGSHHLTGRLTSLAAEKLMTIFDALAAPRPSDEAGPDTRSPGQRRHDALEELTDIALRTQALPDTGGCPTTILITINADTLTARYDKHTRRYYNTDGHPIQTTGTTQHGTRLSIQQIAALAAQAHIIPVYLNNTDGICAFGTTTRLATPAQTRALIARDQGCTFPGCDRPPSWCQRHHIKPWHHGGETNLSNLTLLCGYHHREFETKGWQCHMINGYPHWTPPPWIDPDQKPRLHTRITSTHLGLP